MVDRQMWVDTRTYGLMIALLFAASDRAIAHEVNELAISHAQELIERTSNLPQGFARQVQDDFSSASRIDLDFLPGVSQARHGVALGEMILPARRAGHSLLRAVLSNEGYLNVTSIMSRESVLRDTQAQFQGSRIPDNYGFEIFGEPSVEEP
jgi:hypothetical protein